MTDNTLATAATNEDTPWGFVVCMVLVACGALAGQSSSLFSMIGFNSERSRWDAKEDFRERLIEEVARLEDKLIRARADTAGALAEKQEAESVLSALRSELDSARSRLFEAQDKEAQASASASQLLAVAEVSRKEMASKTAERDSLFNDVQQATTRLAGLRADITQQEGSKAGLSEGVTRLREREEAVRQDLSSAQSALIATNSDLAKIQPRLKEAQDTVSEGFALENDLRNKRLVESSLEVEIQGLADQRESLGNLIANYKKERDALEEENGLLRSTEQRLTKNTTALERDVARLNAEFASLKPQAATLRAALTALQSEEADLHQRLLGVENSRLQKLELDTDVDALTVKRDRLSDEVLQLEKSVSALRASSSLLQDDQANLEGSLKRLRSQEAAVQVEVQALEGLQASRIALRAEVERLEQDKKTLNQQITDSLSENQKSMTLFMGQLIQVLDRTSRGVDSQPGDKLQEDEDKE